MLISLLDFEPNLLRQISHYLTNNDNLHLFLVSPHLMTHYAYTYRDATPNIAASPLFALAARYGSLQCAFIAAHHAGHNATCTRLIKLGAACDVSCWECVKPAFYAIGPRISQTYSVTNYYKKTTH